MVIEMFQQIYDDSLTVVSLKEQLYEYRKAIMYGQALRKVRIINPVSIVPSAPIIQQGFSKGHTSAAQQHIANELSNLENNMRQIRLLHSFQRDIVADVQTRMNYMRTKAPSGKIYDDLWAALRQVLNSINGYSLQFLSQSQFKAKYRDIQKKYQQIRQDLLNAEKNGTDSTMSLQSLKLLDWTDLKTSSEEYYDGIDDISAKFRKALIQWRVYKQQLSDQSLRAVQQASKQKAAQYKKRWQVTQKQLQKLKAEFKSFKQQHSFTDLQLQAVRQQYESEKKKHQQLFLISQEHRHELMKLTQITHTNHQLKHQINELEKQKHIDKAKLKQLSQLQDQYKISLQSASTINMQLGDIKHRMESKMLELIDDHQKQKAQLLIANTGLAFKMNQLEAKFTVLRKAQAFMQAQSSKQVVTRQDYLRMEQQYRKKDQQIQQLYVLMLDIQADKRQIIYQYQQLELQLRQYQSKLAIMAATNQGLQKLNKQLALKYKQVLANKQHAILDQMEQIQSLIRDKADLLGQNSQRKLEISKMEQKIQLYTRQIISLQQSKQSNEEQRKLMQLKVQEISNQLEQATTKLAFVETLNHGLDAEVRQLRQMNMSYNMESRLLELMKPREEKLEAQMKHKNSQLMSAKNQLRGLQSIIMQQQRQINRLHQSLSISGHKKEEAAQLIQQLKDQRQEMEKAIQKGLSQSLIVNNLHNKLKQQFVLLTTRLKDKQDVNSALMSLRQAQHKQYRELKKLHQQSNLMVNKLTDSLHSKNEELEAQAKTYAQKLADIESKSINLSQNNQIVHQAIISDLMIKTETLIKQLGIKQADNIRSAEANRKITLQYKEQVQKNNIMDKEIKVLLQRLSQLTESYEAAALTPRLAAKVLALQRNGVAHTVIGLNQSGLELLPKQYISKDTVFQFGSLVLHLNFSQKQHMWFLGYKITESKKSYFTRQFIKFANKQILKQLIQISSTLRNGDFRVINKGQIYIKRDFYHGRQYIGWRMAAWYDKEPQPTRNGFNMTINQFLQFKRWYNQAKQASMSITGTNALD